MPGASVTARNQALDGLATPVNVLSHVSLHTADPGTTGASEAAGGGYAAQAASWNAAASGAKTNSAGMSFTTDLDVITHFATRNQAAAAGATHGVSGALSSSVTAASITVAAGALSLGVS